MSLRILLGQVLSCDSTKGATAHFWAQRLSGIGILIVGLWFIFSILNISGFEYADVLAFIATPLNGVMLFLLVAVMAYHSNLGIQVIVEDYVHDHGLRLTTLILSRFAHTFLAVAAVYAIIKIGLGA